MSSETIPADLQHLERHANSIAEVADLGAIIVLPAHRDLANGEPELAGEKKQLGIESPMFDLLTAEKGLRGLRSEGFEAALRVLEFQAEHYSQQQIEDASK